jgi:competence ComEA-like helix-hairpin-helix protein
MVSRSLIASMACAASMAMLAAQPPAQDEIPRSRFPVGPGREAVLKVCGDCHGAESAVASLKTHDEWSKTLDDMANNGAQATDDEWNLIQAYLDKHYSFIFVNKATAADLATTLDVPPAVADAIVKRRTDKGGFKTIDDLKSVPGIVAGAIDARKERLIF